MEEVLTMCGTNMASILVQYMKEGSRGTMLEPEMITFRRKGTTGQLGYTMTSDGDQIFHIASITKILVAVALIIAIETRANDEMPKKYAAFRDIQGDRLTQLFNKDNDLKLDDLRGEPTLYNLLVHSKGMPSLNHLFLAMDGTPIMTPSELREEINRLTANDMEYSTSNEAWTTYSNTNYALIAMTIEKLWGGSLKSFMDETLFKPLEMNSTSIGTPKDSNLLSHPWVVDSEGASHRIQNLTYRADGAEAGALGAYSTAHDLDKFFGFILRTFHGTEVIKGVDRTILDRILRMQNEVTKEFSYTPLGLFTTLDSSQIGSMSINRAQFPDETFSKYPVLPGSSGKELSTHYMVGSAIGCYCATAVKPSETPWKNHAIAVLTDTSGPVDPTDHIIRILLRKVAELQYPDRKLFFQRQPKNAKKMTQKALKKTLQKWKKIEENDEILAEIAPKIDKDILGIFRLDGFTQRLYISELTPGNIRIQVLGSSNSPQSRPFDLIWRDANTLKICVPPHLSIDSLGNGDWSQLELTVESEGRRVNKIIRKTPLGEDHYSRDSGTSTSIQSSGDT